MQVLRFVRFAEIAAGADLIAPAPGPLMVAALGISGSATVTLERPRKEQIHTAGPVSGWHFSGRQVWAPFGEFEIGPDVLRSAEIAGGDALTMPELRVCWSAPVEFVLAVISAG